MALMDRNKTHIARSERQIANGDVLKEADGFSVAWHGAIASKPSSQLTKKKFLGGARFANVNEGDDHIANRISTLSRDVKTCFSRRGRLK
ncbi:hypothetical protein ASG19_08645 [Rhizobium sp. Leaf306]|nr:hypothetical protein ASG19_08645 [Rhizobium sp. Leaf306]